MIVCRLPDIIGTERDVHAPTWNSRRLLLSGDGMGFSLHDTIIHEGTETTIWYKHHLEAVYCVEGSGELVPEGEKPIQIGPGTMYALTGHEKHLLRATTRMRMICVFNPPLAGAEVHDAEGVYPAAEQ